MAKVIWSPSSLNDLKLISDYISRDSINRANLFLKRVIDITYRLEDFPLKGKIISEKKDNKYREIIYGAYRIMYKIESETIWILRIVHSSRNWKIDF